jgi:hypothetical protein
VKGVFGVFSVFPFGDSLPARPRDLTGLLSRLREPGAETPHSRSLERLSEPSSWRLSWLELPDFFIERGEYSCHAAAEAVRRVKKK